MPFARACLQAGDIAPASSRSVRHMGTQRVTPSMRRFFKQQRAQCVRRPQCGVGEERNIGFSRTSRRKISTDPMIIGCIMTVSSRILGSGDLPSQGMRSPEGWHNSGCGRPVSRSTHVAHPDGADRCGEWAIGLIGQPDRP